MAKYITREITTIEAEQFLPPNQIPEGLISYYHMPDGSYCGEVRTLQNQVVTVKPTEWIVQEPDNPNRHYPIHDEVFKRKYKLVE